MQPAVEAARAGGFEEIAWRDEDQFAARCEVTHAFLDEEEVEIAAPVEAVVTEQGTGGGRDVLIAHVGRVADHRVEFLRFRIGEEIEVVRAGRAVKRIQLDADGAVQMLQEGSVAAGRFQYAAVVVSQAQHGADDRLRGEHLAEARYVGRKGG